MARMASLFSLFDEAFLLPIECLAHNICDGVRDLAEVLCSRLSKVHGGECWAEAARGALDALLPAEEKASAQGHWWRMVGGPVEGEEEGEVERDEEGLAVIVCEDVREEEDMEGSLRTACAEDDCQQAPSAEPLSDVVHASPAAASAPDQTEQRGTGMAEAEATVAGEEADDSGAREGDVDRSPGAFWAESGHHEAPSAAPLAAAAATPPAAAPTPAAPHTTSPQKEQRSSSRGRSPSAGLASAGGGIFSADAFTLPSDDGTLFSDPHFDYTPLPAPDFQAPTTIILFDRQSTPQLPETLRSTLGLFEVVMIGGDDRAECEAVGGALGGGTEVTETLGRGEGETPELSYGEALLPGGILTDMDASGAEAGEEAAAPMAPGWDPSAQAGTAASRIPLPYSFLEGVLDYYPGITLDRELGRGGQGAVYLALATRPTGEGFLVAAKVPLASLPGDYLLPEALSWVECASCPSMISLVGFSVHQGTFIPLFALADPSPSWTEPGVGVQQTPFELYRVVLFAHTIARAVAAMHALGWLHCDIKTDNVLFKDNCPVLADFGLAIHECDAPGRGTCGSRGYLSPEVYLNGYHTRKSDVYALGILIWALATGDRPHVGFRDTRALLAYMAMGGWYSWPAEVHAHGGDLMALVERCCDANPDRRPTASQLADELFDISELLRAECTDADTVRGWEGSGGELFIALRRSGTFYVSWR